MPKKEYYSITEVADFLGLSRVAIYYRVKQNKIKAIKIGKHYAIPYKELVNLTGYIIREPLTKENEKKIDESINKVFKDYGEVIKKLGNE